MFHDEAEIMIKSGKGGDGCVSFRREKFVPEGGPDGGDGGKGGDVVVLVNPHINTLSGYIRQRHWKAGNGIQGGGRNCSGKSADDLILEVPAGTLVRHAVTGELLADMCESERRVVLAAGGKGGSGNVNFKSSTNQTPRKATLGKMGVSFDIKLELKLIADIGFMGFPNAGKSTLLAALSSAKPKIANYPFTTLAPQLGVMEANDNQIVLADIPGLIEGASEGVGLGHQFLRHIERCQSLLHLVDATDDDVDEIIEKIEILNRELEKFSPKLSKREQMICLNKADMREDIEEVAKELSEKIGQKVYTLSAYTRKVDSVRNAILADFSDD